MHLVRRLAPLAALALVPAALLLAPAEASPGWDLILDRPSPNFGGIDFVSPSEGWLVAGAGLLHTSDGGATWTEAERLTGIDVDFADPDHGWLVGYDGDIWATADGGATWTPQTSGTPVHLSDVHAVSPTEAWAVGSGIGFSDVVIYPIPTALLHTTDGGATWTRVDTPPDTWFKEITFVGMDGWALGQCGSSIAPPPGCGPTLPAGGPGAVLLRTTDGGASWTLIDSGVPPVTRDLVFVSASEGWLLGYKCATEGCFDTVFHTTDGGVTWTPQLQAGHFESFDALTFRDGSAGWVMGQGCGSGGCSLVFWVTEDGGATWDSGAIGPSFTGTSVSKLLEFGGTLYAAGRGIAIRSTDGGANWQPLDTPAIDLGPIDFVDREVGFTISRIAFMRTDDAGASWRRVGPAPAAGHRLDFLDASRGFTAGYDCGPSGCRFLVSKTTNGGVSWTTVFSGSPTIGSLSVAFSFLDAGHGWVLLEGGFLVTGDGGATWQERPFRSGPFGTPTAAAVDGELVDASNGWALVRDDATHATDLWRTTDGGRTWQAVPGRSGPEFSQGQLDFVDADHGWYTSQVCELPCTTTLLMTADGGASWQEVGLGDDYVQDLAFVDQLNGWLSVQRCEARCTGEVLHSADGGRTWASQAASFFGDFEFVDVENGWVLPAEVLALGGGPPGRTLLYHTSDAGGGPIGRLPTPTAEPTVRRLPDTGGSQAGSSNGALPLVAAGLIAGALGAGLVLARLRLRRGGC